MKVVACIKPIYNPEKVKVHKRTETLLLDDVPLTINPYDKFVIDAALYLQKEINAHVIALCLGNPEAENVLRKALSFGINEGVMVNAPSLGELNSLSQSYLLSEAMKKIGFDLILCGKTSQDYRSGLTGPQMAELLNIPFIPNVKEIRIEKRELTVKAKFQDQIIQVSTHLPALLTIQENSFPKRYQTSWEIHKAYKKEIKVLTVKDLNIKEEALREAVTKVKKKFLPSETKKRPQILEGKPKQLAHYLLKQLEKY